MKNAAAIGYMVLAAKRFNWDIEQIENLAIVMTSMMDIHTEDEAEEAYRDL